MTSSRMTRAALVGIAAGLCLTPAEWSTALAASSPEDALRSVAKRTGRARFARWGREIAAPENDQTLAPYFHVPGSGDVDDLPLKETRANVNIAGVIASVRVTQVYENQAKTPIEAVYVFPASTRAAVHGMRMKIGKRTVEARIERRQKARQDYEQAREQGRRASLLEQQRENVFTMNVANIMPGDRIDVELDYSELLVPEDNVYEFVYPTVVGPRYGGGADPDRDRWIASPYLKEGEPEPYVFDVQASLDTSIALKDVSSPSHGIDVDYASASSATVRLSKAGGGNRDFILRYRLAGDRIETGLLLFEGKNDKTFALMMEPPRRPSSADIPRREFIFLLDVSGSMNGFPLDTAKALMRDLLQSLRPKDSFNIVLFAGASHVMSRTSLPANGSNIEKGLELVGRQRGGGGTELMAGLQAAYGIDDERSGTSRTVVVITDGFVGVEAQAFRFIRERMDDANLFAFGIGSSVNRALIEGMARAGMGEPFVVLKSAKAKQQADRFREMIERPVLTDIDVRIRGLDAVDVLPDKVPDLLAQRPIVLMGQYRGRAGGTIEIRGKTGRGPFQKTIRIDRAAARAEHEPLRQLWARRWVSTLEDELSMGSDAKLEEAVTNLGLDYSLLTRFTSFVATDSEVVNDSGKQTRVKQPVPLPEGVSDLAVGGQGQMVMKRALRKQAAPRFYSFGGGAAAAPPAELDALLSGAVGGRNVGGGGSSRSASEESAPPKPQLGISVASAKNVERVDSLRRAIKKQLQGGPCGSHTKIRVRLTVDGNGKVTAVKVLGANAGTTRCLIARLRGLKSNAHATAQKAYVEVLIEAR